MQITHRTLQSIHKATGSGPSSTNQGKQGFTGGAFSLTPQLPPLPLSLPESPAYTSCLVSDQPAFYYTNQSNTSPHSGQISHDT